MDELENIAVATTDAMLAEGGFVPPPTTHMFCNDLGSQSYAGYVRARTFYPGGDAHTAVETLGLVASFVSASRLVLVWEQADLQIALQSPGELQPTGLVVVDAPRVGEHVVRWNPAELVQTGTRADGCPVVEASWGPAQRIPGGPAAGAGGRGSGAVAVTAGVVGCGDRRGVSRHGGRRLPHGVAGAPRS